MSNKAIRSWIMYDWANSAFATTMMAAVLPIFYTDVAAKDLPDHVATSYWGFTQTIAMLIIAFMSPLLGAIADYSGAKVKLLIVSALFGICSTFAFVFVGSGDYILASILFIIGLVGYNNSLTFYDGLLPDLVEEDMRDMVSSKGYAYGYLGGGFLLVINLLWIQQPSWFGISDSLTGIRLSFISVGIWWLLFSLPIIRNVTDKANHAKGTLFHYVRIGFNRNIQTFKSIKKHKQLLKFLIAFWLFNDGISTIISMATIYGKEIGIGTSDLIAALVITQIVGFPFTLLFGKISDKWSSKKTLVLTLWIYVIIVILGYFMQSALHFYLLAIMVGVVQGGSQAIARSIFSNLVPKDKTAEFFGFLNLSSKFSSILGPLVFSTVGLLAGSSRFGILALILFFLAGIFTLSKVDLVKGKQEMIEQ